MTTNITIAERIQAKNSSVEVPSSQVAALSELDRLRAENATLQAKLERKGGKAPSLTVKTSEKKGISLYGLQRFPITLYASGWLKLTQPENIALVRKHITEGFGGLSFTSVESRDEAVKVLALAGFMVSDDDVAAATIAA